jgi:hypothetical protein
MSYLTRTEKFIQTIYLVFYSLLFVFTYFSVEDRSGLVICYLINFAMIYQCVIAHPGTVFLSINMFFNVLLILFYAYDAFLLLPSQFFSSQLSVAAKHLLLADLFTIVLSAVFFFFHRELRKINIDLQARLVLNEEPNLFSSWDNATSLEEFAKKFLAAIERWPKYEKGLTKRYKQINIDLQERLVSNEEPDLFSSWDNSTTAKELKTEFLNAVKKWPKYEKGLANRYKKLNQQFIQ